MPKSEVPKLVAQVKLAPPVVQPKLNAPAVARSGAETMTAMDRVNQDKSVEYRIMNQRDERNPLAPVPSERNAAPQVGFAAINADLTFSRIAATHGNSSYVRSRKVGE
jgi:hypothetical protein